MEKLVGAIIVFLFTVTLIVFLSLLGAIITQYAWNLSLAQIFTMRVPEIDFWQAFWLNLLGGMLFKSSGNSK